MINKSRKRSLLDQDKFEARSPKKQNISLPENLDSLPDDLIQRISDYLDMRSVSNILVISKNLYSRICLKVTLLLCDTYWGRQDKIERTIRYNPRLLSIKGMCIDLSQRVFNGITAFQYAWWACDWYMWRMMIKYMDKSEVLGQVAEIESNRLSWVSEHGQEFNISGLTNAYDEFLSNQTNDNWCKGVAVQLRFLPSHIISEYCREDRSIVHSDFRDESEPPRHDGAWWFFELYSVNYNLGVEHAIFLSDIPGKKNVLRTNYKAPSLLPSHITNYLSAYKDQKITLNCMNTRKAQKAELLCQLRR